MTRIFRNPIATGHVKKQAQESRERGNCPSTYEPSCNKREHREDAGNHQSRLYPQHGIKIHIGEQRIRGIEAA